MSMDTWIIQGVGINTDKIYNYIDKAKLAVFLHQQLPDDERLVGIDSSEQCGFLDIEDFLYGEPFQNIGDLLTHCDNSDTLTYGDDGEGGSYLFYPPSMPWERLPNEPQSIGVVHQRIIQAVKGIVSNLSDIEIDTMIDDDLYVVGMG